jgi:hypothetical protein
MIEEQQFEKQYAEDRSEGEVVIGSREGISDLPHYCLDRRTYSPFRVIICQKHPVFPTPPVI